MDPMHRESETKQKILHLRITDNNHVSKSASSTPHRRCAQHSRRVPLDCADVPGKQGTRLNLRECKLCKTAVWFCFFSRPPSAHPSLTWSEKCAQKATYLCHTLAVSRNSSQMCAGLSRTGFEHIAPEKGRFPDYSDSRTVHFALAQISELECRLTIQSITHTRPLRSNPGLPSPPQAPHTTRALRALYRAVLLLRTPVQAHTMLRCSSSLCQA